jgi:hypothetical protein
LAQKEIEYNQIRTYKQVHGLEDCRLVLYENDLYFTTVTFDFDDYQIPRIGLGRIDNIYQSLTGTDEKIKISKIIKLHGPNPNRCEKNWLPFVHDGVLSIIYGFEPLTIYVPDIETGLSKIKSSKNAVHDLSKLRGSAPPIRYGEGYLSVSHEVIFNAHYERSYLHRFIYLDAELNIVKLSGAFYFEHKGIEYCSGATLSIDSKSLLLTAGLRDKEAYIFEVDTDVVDNMLIPISNYADY